MESAFTPDLAADNLSSFVTDVLKGLEKAGHKSYARSTPDYWMVECRPGCVAIRKSDQAAYVHTFGHGPVEFKQMTPEEIVSVFKESLKNTQMPNDWAARVNQVIERLRPYLAGGAIQYGKCVDLDNKARPSVWAWYKPYGYLFDFTVLADSFSYTHDKMVVIPVTESLDELEAEFKKWAAKIDPELEKFKDVLRLCSNKRKTDEEKRDTEIGQAERTRSILLRINALSGALLSGKAEKRPLPVFNTEAEAMLSQLKSVCDKNDPPLTTLDKMEKKIKVMKRAF